MDALLKHLRELDAERADVTKKIEAKKLEAERLHAASPILHGEIEAIIAKALLAKHETSCVYLPSGLHMTDLSVYEGGEWPTVPKELDIKKVVQYDIRSQ